MEIPIQAVNHITFSVAQLDRSVDFYEKVFEAKLRVRGENMAYLEVGGLWLALNVQKDIPRQEIHQSYSHIAFSINELELGKMQERLQNLGIQCRTGRPRDEGDGESIYFTDPDGHLLEFHTGDLETRIQAYRRTESNLSFYEGKGEEYF